MERFILHLLLAILGVACTLIIGTGILFLLILVGYVFIESVWPVIWATIIALSHILISGATGFAIFAIAAVIVNFIFDKIGLKKDDTIL
jgi:hypothetical protein